MLITVLAVVLLAFSFASSPTESCCLPGKWETFAGIMSGVVAVKGRNVTLTTGNVRVSYDASDKTEKVSLIYQVMLNGISMDMKMIFDYAKGTSYTIHGGKCQKDKLTKKFEKWCVDDKSTKLNDTYYGLGDGKLGVTVYQLVSDDGCEYVTVTKDCFPLDYKIATISDIAESLTTLNVMGATLGIKDPKIFDPPASCDKYAGGKSIMDADLEHVMKLVPMFSRLHK